MSTTNVGRAAPAARLDAGGTDARRSHRSAPKGVRKLGEGLFVLPIVVVIGLFILVPTVTAFAHSFTDWTPGSSSAWVGLHNYVQMFSSPEFAQILLNQAFLLIGLPIWILVPLVFAYLLYERVPGAGVFRAIMFFPATASPALIGILFTFILAPFGPVNSGLKAIGLGFLAKLWLSDPHLVKPVLIAVLTWATMGTGVVIYSAGLGAVPRELFEAATLDGANWWQRLRNIVLPSLRPLAELWSVIMVIVVFVQMFPWVFTLTKGGPGFSSTTLDYDIYARALSSGEYGSAAAEMVVLLLIVLGVILIGRLIFRWLGTGEE